MATFETIEFVETEEDDSAVVTLTHDSWDAAMMHLKSADVDVTNPIEVQGMEGYDGDLIHYIHFEAASLRVTIS